MHTNSRMRKAWKAINSWGRFAAEAIGCDVEFERASRHRSARGSERIERIAGRRREHEIGGAQRVGPILSGIEPSDCGVDLRLVALQAADAAQQVRESRGDSRTSRRGGGS